jgi:hypothetical protein
MGGIQRRAFGQASPWQKPCPADHCRHRPSGTYFVLARLEGKPIRQLLNTQVFAIARLRFKDVLGAHRRQSINHGRSQSGE